MNAIDINRYLTEAMQAGAEEFCKLLGVPQAKYQSVVLGVKWKQAMKERRAAIAKQMEKEAAK